MALTAYVALACFVAIGIFIAGITKAILEARKSPIAVKRRVIVNDRQEYLSVWEIAHQWEGMDSLQTDRSNVPVEIKQRINRILLAYFRKELALRKPDGLRLLGHHPVHGLLLVDNQYEKLWDDMMDDKLDMRLVDCLFVRRGEILQWCAKDFVEPPSCWALQSGKTPTGKSSMEDDSKDDWYRKLTPQRKEKVACLEVAKHLWEQHPGLLYEEVRTHEVMTRAGLRNVFTVDTFKTWARDIAPEEAKKGGRRSQSNA